MRSRVQERLEPSVRCPASTVPAGVRRWQVLSHLREPERIAGAVRRTAVGGRGVFVAPPGTTAPPDCGPTRTLDAIRRFSRNDLPTWIERFRSAAIVADRVTSPDLLAQLDQSSRRPIHSVLCNGLDPDPQTDLQARLAIESPDELHAGVLALMRLLGAARGLVCLPPDCPQRGAFADRLSRRAPAEPETRFVPNVYPIAEPSLLLLELLRLRLPPGSLPTSVGVLLLDVSAAIDIGRVLLTGQSPEQVTMLVMDGQADPIAVGAPIGCTLGDVLDAARSSWRDRQLRAGAQFREVTARADDIVGPGEHIVHVMPPDDRLSATACVRCGWCADVCPTRAMPAGLLEAAQRRDRRLGERHGLDACVDCGLCSQVCPSRLPLLSAIARLRRETPTREGVSA